MRIVHTVYSMEMGGAEMLVAQLARLQTRRGHEVTICAYSKRGVLGEALVREGIPMYVLGEAHPFRTILRYIRLFRRMRPDVVHCHNPAPTLQAALGARLAGSACVLATRHSLVSPPYDRSAEVKFSLFASFMDWTVGICDITCENLRGAPLARRDRIVRVYNGALPVPAVSLELKNSEYFTLLFVGRVAAVKDLQTLLRAASQAATTIPNLRLWIVGDGPVRPELEQLADELGMQNIVTFWGEKTDTESFFNAADAIAMSSVSEGLPMSLVQGMSLGLPIVVTSVGGMKEIIDLCGCGLASPIGDWKAMAQSFVRLASNDSLRAEFGSRAKQAFESYFTLEKMAKQYEKLYRSGREAIY